MYLIGSVSAVAPTTTGHPLGLPGDANKTSNELKIAPAAKSDGAPNTATNDMPQERLPSRRADAEGDASKSAPPTILQLKIDAMLREQAQAESVPPPETLPADPVETRSPVSLYTEDGTTLSAQAGDMRPVSPMTPAPDPSPTTAIGSPSAPQMQNEEKDRASVPQVQTPSAMQGVANRG